MSVVASQEDNADSCESPGTVGWHQYSPVLSGTFTGNKQHLCFLPLLAPGITTSSLYPARILSIPLSNSAVILDSFSKCHSKGQAPLILVSNYPQLFPPCSQPSVCYKYITECLQATAVLIVIFNYRPLPFRSVQNIRIFAITWTQVYL